MWAKDSQELTQTLKIDERESLSFHDLIQEQMFDEYVLALASWFLENGLTNVFNQYDHWRSKLCVYPTHTSVHDLCTDSFAAPSACSPNVRCS